MTPLIGPLAADPMGARAAKPWRDRAQRSGERPSAGVQLPFSLLVAEEAKIRVEAEVFRGQEIVRDGRHHVESRCIQTCFELAPRETILLELESHALACPVPAVQVLDRMSEPPPYDRLQRDRTESVPPLFSRRRNSRSAARGPSSKCSTTPSEITASKLSSGNRDSQHVVDQYRCRGVVSPGDVDRVGSQVDACDVEPLFAKEEDPSTESTAGFQYPSRARKMFQKVRQDRLNVAELDILRLPFPPTSTGRECAQRKRSRLSGKFCRALMSDRFASAILRRIGLIDYRHEETGTCDG